MDATHLGPDERHLLAAPTYRPAPAGRFVGARVARREDRRLVTGHARFVADVVVPGMVHAVFVRSDVARARITGVDVDAARRAPGVVAVFTADDLPLPGTMRTSLASPTVPAPDERGLARDDVRYVGEPVVLVVATSAAAAEDARELVEVDYELQAAVVDHDPTGPADGVVHPEIGGNVASSRESAPDDELAALLVEAPLGVTLAFRQQRQTNAPMETRGIVVEWDPWLPQLTVHASSQNPHEFRRVCARLLGLDERVVRVVQRDVGGGFGQKMFLTRDEAVIVLAAHRLARPVRWIEERRENLTASNSARADTVEVRLAADADGRILGARLDLVEDVGAYPLSTPGGVGTYAATLLPGPYRIPRLAWSTTAVWTNTCGRAPYRGPWMIETLARERAVDELARRAGVDPLELRRRNVLQWDDLPHTTPSGYVYRILTPAECLEQATAMIDYDGFRAEQQARREDPPPDGRLLGIGISLCVEPSAAAVGLMATEAATIRVAHDGSVDVFVGTGAHGQGLETTLAQVVADEIGVDFDTVAVHQGDTSSTPFGAGTGGSRSAVIVGGAAREASVDIRDRLRQIAAHLLEAAPDDVEIVDGRAAVRGTPARSLGVAELARVAYDDVARLPPGLAPGLEVTARYAGPPVTWSNSCHICTVEVDPETGGVRVLRYVVSEDCGVMVNPDVVEGQIAGGVVQGIAGVLLEDSVIDGSGIPLATTFTDYLVPSAAEIPSFEYGHVETPSDTPGGHKGMGEGGAIAAPAAVANAVADALAPLGVQVRDLPLGPSQVRALVQAARAVTASHDQPGPRS